MLANKLTGVVSVTTLGRRRKNAEPIIFDLRLLTKSDRRGALKMKQNKIAKLSGLRKRAVLECQSLNLKLFP